MIEYAEKRDFLRMPIDCELSYTETGSSKQLQGNVINLSSKGILFTSNQKFDPGTSLDIVLTPSNSLTPPMEATVIPLPTELTTPPVTKIYFDILPQETKL